MSWSRSRDEVEYTRGERNSQEDLYEVHFRRGGRQPMAYTRKYYWKLALAFVLFLMSIAMTASLVMVVKMWRKSNLSESTSTFPNSLNNSSLTLTPTSDNSSTDFPVITSGSLSVTAVPVNPLNSPSTAVPPTHWDFQENMATSSTSLSSPTEPLIIVPTEGSSEEAQHVVSLAPPTIRALPSNIFELHPTSLLNQVFPNDSLIWKEIDCAEGQPPTFMFILHIKGLPGNFTGESRSKKEAKLAASKLAVETIFEIDYTGKLKPPRSAHRPCIDE